MSTTLTSPAHFTPAQLATALATQPAFAFDRDSTQRQLARLQSIYATKIAQLDALCFLFDEGSPDIILRGESKELVLRLGEAAVPVYTMLNEALTDALVKLEKDIVATHLKIEREANEALLCAADPDYASALLPLCMPVISKVKGIAPPSGLRLRSSNGNQSIPA